MARLEDVIPGYDFSNGQKFVRVWHLHQTFRGTNPKNETNINTIPRH
jgi:hypothetical protein